MIGITKNKIGAKWRDVPSLRLDIRPSDRILGVHAFLLDEVLSKASHAESVEGVIDNKHEAIQDLFKSHRGRFHKRMLFGTRDMGWGLGPQILEAGDDVAFILDSYAPAILRPHGEDFKMVGLCSLPGSFVGERAMKLLQGRGGTQRKLWLV